VTFNKSGSESGLAGCGSATSMPLLQDSPEGVVWTTLNMPYNGFLVVDPFGRVVARLTNTVFPAVGDELETVVWAVLP